MKIKNVSPRGDLDVPLLGVVVPAGESVTVSPEAAARLLPQVGNWAPADKAAEALAAELAEGTDTEGDPA